MSLVPTFHTKRLVIRELVESDASAYAKHFVNYEVIRHLGSQVPWPYPSDGVLTYMRNELLPFQGTEKWTWALALKEDPNALIGAVELLKKASPSNRGFWLGQPYWGKGYMTEAVIPITNFAFDALGFEKLLFSNAVGNKRSARIKEKSGARFVKREAAHYVDPELRERDVYELTKEAWQKEDLGKVAT